MIWGKLLGGVFGFMIGGPLGAVIGAALGHKVDSGLSAEALPPPDHWEEEALAPGDADRIRMGFFSATFAVMGHVAKADGRVHPSEIALAESVMDSMQLTPELRTAAIKLFTEGKDENFELRAVVLQFRRECQRRTNLYRMFLEIQIQAALADGVIREAEHKVLLTIADVLGFPDFIFNQLVSLVSAGMGIPASEAYASAATGDKRSDDSTASGNANSSHKKRHRSVARPNNELSVQDAESLLGVSRTDDKATVKRAYRRMMSQHHPDKLIAKGLPEEMIRLATDKTQNIRKAYERIKRARGWRSK